MKLLKPLLGDVTAINMKKVKPTIDAINALEPQVQAMDDAAIQARMTEIKTAIRDEYKTFAKESDRAILNKKTQALLDKHAVEVFALTREAANRTLGKRHYDVQLMGGLMLHQGKIAEMKTGEGKTLVATLPLVLNALLGRGAHLVTVNDYLSRRDAGWNAPLYHFLGLSVAAIGHEKSLLYDPSFTIEDETDQRLAHFRPVPRREAYAADITYGTNNEFGFDYLRDHMVFRVDHLRQRPFYFGIVDEVDSILIDEARTPLIISGAAAESTSLYATFAQIVPRLKKDEDYKVDEKVRSVALEDSGIAKVEKALGIDNIYDGNNILLVHHLEEALKAEALFHKNKDYVIKDGEVVIVDEFTGRMMPGRRYNEGLHQAIEAKEGVAVQRESETQATISFQNLFRLYPKLSGMTGTAATEAEEFYKIYGLEVIVIPTHRPTARIDTNDLIYKNEEAKINAVVADIVERQKNGQPVLVGTISVEKSEHLSKALKSAGIAHQVLNAKHHEKEAKVVAQAGKPGTVTVATNMAGRGVDIMLGGNPPETDNKKEWEQWEKDRALVLEQGGLRVIGTERHESRRIDNQLRGRSGRQGDPGSTVFYVSMDDDLMRIFGGERLKGMMDRLGVPDDQPITANLISRSIESAQKRVEGQNFDSRKRVVDYDDVMNKHREVIYRKRTRILELERPLEDGSSPFAQETWLHQDLTSLMTDEELAQYEEKVKKYGLELVQQVERQMYLEVIDQYWIDHLNQMEQLLVGIGLRGYAQVDPLVEYKRESYGLFERLLGAIEAEMVQALLRVEISQAPQPQQERSEQGLHFQGADESLAGGAILPVSANPDQAMEQVREIAKEQAVQAEKAAESDQPKVGRNDPCPCGSGKKYKKCHGA